MSAIAVGLALLALGSAPVIGTPLPDQAVHLKPGEVVTIRLEGGDKPKWVIASVGRAGNRPTARERVVNQAVLAQLPTTKPGEVAPPARLVSTENGYRMEVLTKGKADAGQTPPMSKDIPVEEGAATEPEPLPADVVRLSLKPAPVAPGMMLLVENGYAHNLRYKAVLRTGTRSQRTDVCDVPDKLTSYEHWPYYFESIDLSDFVVTDKTRQDGIACK